jgi:putative transcriptional regulator
MPIVVRIDVELARRKMSVGEFADRVGLTPANVAVLKNGRAKAVRFSTLEAMCRVLGCQPGDLLEWVDDGNDRNDGNDGQNDDVDAGNEGTSAAAGGGSAAVYGEGGA